MHLNVFICLIKVCHHVKHLRLFEDIFQHFDCKCYWYAFVCRFGTIHKNRHILLVIYVQDSFFTVVSPYLLYYCAHFIRQILKILKTKQTMWHFGACVQPLLLWKRNKYCIFWVCVCSFRYLRVACNAHALFYSVICGLPVSAILLHIISQTERFLRKLLNSKCMFLFSVQLFFLEHFLF
jgi:hypothetical protein